MKLLHMLIWLTDGLWQTFKTNGASLLRVVFAGGLLFLA